MGSHLGALVEGDRGGWIKGRWKLNLLPLPDVSMNDIRSHYFGEVRAQQKYIVSGGTAEQRSP